MSVSPDELVELQLKIKYTEALIAIRKVLEGYKSLDGSAKAFANFVVASSKQMGVSSAVFLKNLKEINKELSKVSSTGRGPLGGLTGGVLGNQFNATVKENIKELEKVEPAAKRAGQGISGIRPAAESAVQGLFSLKNMARIALGTLEAMSIFLIMQFVQNAVKKAIDGIRQLELALYNLSNAEKALSNSGIEISMSELKDIVKEIVDLFPYISKIDATRLVSKVALLGKDLNLTKQQMEDLAKAAVVLANRTGQTIENVIGQLINGVSSSGRGLKDLFVPVDALIIKQEAIDSGLVKNEEAWNNLTAAQRQNIEVAAILQIVNRNVNDEIENQAPYLKTLDSNVRDLSAAWEDFLTGLGRISGPAMIGGLKLLVDQLERMNTWLTKNEANLTKIVATFAGLIAAQKALNASKEQETWVDKVLGFISPALEEVRRLGKFGASDFADAFQKGFDDAIKSAKEFGDATETDTALIEDLGDAISGLDPEQIEKLDKEMKDFYEDLEKLQEKAERLEEDFQISQGRKEADYLTNRKQKEQDYQIARNRVIQDFNAKRKEIEQKYRDKELNDEAKFQEQLRQLREKYLFNLEDALHERDARQVLRLQRQYQMDRQNLVNENALKKQEDRRQKAEDIADAKADLAEKLARMDEEHRIQMERDAEDYRLKKKREEEDHAQDMADLKQEISDRITEMTRALTEEYGLNAAASQDLQDLLTQYYGPGGIFDQLYGYSYDSMVAHAQAMMAQLQQLLAMGSMVGGPAPVAPGMGGGGGVPRRARGGSFLATSPTKAIYGERGPEVATFTPLRNIGSGLLGGMDKAMSMGGGNGGGMMRIELLLSPDLEARVVENTLSKTADIVTKVARSK